MMKYQFEWASGFGFADGESVEEACSNLKVNPRTIFTGWLVRVRKLEAEGKVGNWGYWDAEMFWHYLRGKSSGQDRGAQETTRKELESVRKQDEIRTTSKEQVNKSCSLPEPPKTKRLK